MTTTVPQERQPEAITLRRRPSKRGYWIGGLLAAAAVIGTTAWAVIAFFGYQHGIDRFQRMNMPGRAMIHVASMSTRVVYFENQRGVAAPALSQLGISLTDSTGAPVVVNRYGGDLRYDVPNVAGRVGRAVATFHPTMAGDYQLQAAPSAAVTGTLAVGHDIVTDITPDLIGAGALFLLIGGAGITTLVVTAVRRSSARSTTPGGLS